MNECVSTIQFSPYNYTFRSAFVKSSSTVWREFSNSLIRLHSPSCVRKLIDYCLARISNLLARLYIYLYFSRDSYII